MTDYERAIDAENRRLFPGDYVTEDEEDKDSYGVDCAYCDDHGCAKCHPIQCTACDDHGCATCDPSGVCEDCKHYMADVETLDKDGRCSNCAYFANLRYCDCGSELTDSDEGDLCTACQDDRSRPICIDNCSEFADGDDGLCSGCRWHYQNMCPDCNYNLRDAEDGLCSDCRKGEAEMLRYYVWWRRALRACMFWR